MQLTSGLAHGYIMDDLPIADRKEKYLNPNLN